MGFSGQSMKYKQIKLVIKGRVQGVGFRYSTQEIAVELGLGGWVRNLPTGDVETLAVGPQEKIDEFLAWCRVGPTHARVDSVEVTLEENLDVWTEKEFKILR